jgi:ComF family protein
LSNRGGRSFDCGRSRLPHGARRAALPQHCALCAARAGNTLVCAACATTMPRTSNSCPVCALATPDATVCGACLAHRPAFAATIAAFVYAFPVDHLLQALKYGGRLALAEWAANALADAVVARGAPVDAIVALPLAPSRQRERGFNQAQEIARRVARALRLPLVDALARVSSGPPQAMLAWTARAQNVRGAFACRRDVRGLRLAVVDDVMTTGATIAEAARSLNEAGAARVDAWVVARTPRPDAAE